MNYKNKKTASPLVIAVIVLALLLMFAGVVAILNGKCKFGHAWTDGVCERCATVCTHEEVESDGLCNECGLAVNIENEIPLAVDTATGEALVSGQAYAMTNMAFTTASAMSSTELEGITITAVVLPEYASNKAVDWSISWVNEASEWATGKSVTDYVTVTPVSDGSLECVVSCLAPFGEQIKVTVVSRDNPEASSEITVDYLQAVTGVQLKVGDIVLTSGDNYIEDFVVESGKTGPGGQPALQCVGGDVYTIGVNTDFYKDFFLTLDYSFEEYDSVTGENVVNEYSLSSEKIPDSNTSSVTFDVDWLTENFGAHGSNPYTWDDGTVHSKISYLNDMSTDFLKEIFENKEFMQIAVSVEHNSLPDHIYFNLIVNSIADISVESVSVESDNLTFGGE